jgi:hypothetical protein
MQGGFDECLPSVAPRAEVGGKPPVGDHGDLWRLAWRSEVTSNSVKLEASATSRPLRMTRTATLRGSVLVLQYDLENLSDKPVEWLWSAHPLFAVSAGDRIILPKRITTAVVEGSLAGDFTQGAATSSGS